MRTYTRQKYGRVLTARVRIGDPWYHASALVLLVCRGERPDWRPDYGFEAKGVRAGRTVTELTCTLRPEGGPSEG